MAKEEVERFVTQKFIQLIQEKIFVHREIVKKIYKKTQEIGAKGWPKK